MADSLATFMWRLSRRNVSWEVKAAGAWADILATLMWRLSRRNVSWEVKAAGA